MTREEAKTEFINMGYTNKESEQLADFALQPVAIGCCSVEESVFCLLKAMRSLEANENHIS
jgi:hypothetical protein